MAPQAPLSTGFSRQEYRRGLPCPPPGHLPDPGIKPRSPALQADSLPTELPGKLYSQIYGFSNSHVWMWESNHKQGWVMKNWRFRTVVLEQTFESPFNSKKIKPVNPNGNQSWIFIGRTDVEVEAPVLWPPDTKSRVTGIDPDAGKEWRQKGKRQQRRRLDSITDSNGHESEQTPGRQWRMGGCCATVHEVTKSWTKHSNNIRLYEIPFPTCPLFFHPPYYRMSCFQQENIKNFKSFIWVKLIQWAKSILPLYIITYQ